jgi:mono/diheme cytochrome c family protein
VARPTPGRCAEARGALQLGSVRLSLIALIVLAAACGDKRELREWKPSDHQPPPVVAPEGQGEGSEDEGDPEARAAQALWQMRCSQCHGAEGHGDGPGKPPGAQIPDMTSAAFHDARSDAAIGEVIAKGRGLMPSFEAQLSEDGIAAMVRHVRALKQ